MNFLDFLPALNVIAAVGVLTVACLFKWKSKHKEQ